MIVEQRDAEDEPHLQHAAMKAARLEANEQHKLMSDVSTQFSPPSVSDTTNHPKNGNLCRSLISRNVSHRLINTFRWRTA